MDRIKFRLTLMVAVVVAMVSTASVAAAQQPVDVPGAQTRQQNDQIIRVHFDYTDVSSPLTTTWNNIIIDHVGAGLTISGERIQGIVHDAGDGVTHLFDIRQNIAVELAHDRGRRISVSGESDARLRSAATGAVFHWSPRVTGQAVCTLSRADRSGADSPDTCLRYEIQQVHAGSLSGPDGRGTCGSLRQEVTYVIAMDQDLETERAFGGFVDTAGDGAHSIGGLKVANDRCAASIYGVMPGDNITILPDNATAWVTADGVVLSSEGGSVVADIAFVGQLRDGTRVSGQGRAHLTVRSGSAQGDITGELVIVGSDALFEFEGRLTLENIEGTGEGAFSAQGRLQVLTSNQSLGDI